MAKIDWRVGEMPDEYLEKLPLYAQKEVLLLRQQLSFAEGNLNTLRSSVRKEQSNVQADPYGPTERYLPRDTHITYDLGSEWRWQEEIAVRLADSRIGNDSRALQLQGGRGLLIEPYGSNLVYVTTNTY